MRNNPSHLAYIVLSPILSTSFALLNVASIIIFCTRFRLASLALVVVVNICVCDIFVCLISNSFYMINLLHPVHAWSTGSTSCKMFKYFTMLSNITQIFLLCALNADGLRRLVYNNAKQWTKRNGIIITTICWIKSSILCLPRLILFDEKTTVTFTANRTDSFEMYSCKPIGMDTADTTAVTVVTFVLAYVLPAMFIMYTSVRSQLFMWKRRRCIHMSTISNTVLRMNRKLSLTFNLTGALFMLIWTPFFVLSLFDISVGLHANKKYMHENFSFRCTLLILGSSKPLIYLLCLDKFRKCFSCKTPMRSDDSSTTPNETNLPKPSGNGVTNITESTV